MRSGHWISGEEKRGSPATSGGAAWRPGDCKVGRYCAALTGIWKDQYLAQQAKCVVMSWSFTVFLSASCSCQECNGPLYGFPGRLIQNASFSIRPQSREGSRPSSACASTHIWSKATTTQCISSRVHCVLDLRLSKVGLSTEYDAFSKRSGDARHHEGLFALFRAPRLLARGQVWRRFAVGIVRQKMGIWVSNVRDSTTLPISPAMCPVICPCLGNWGGP